MDRSAKMTFEIRLRRPGMANSKKQDVVAWLKAHSAQLLKATVVANCSTPPLVNSLEFRMHKPAFFNKCVERELPNECSRGVLQIVESNCDSFDWYLQGKRVSNKIMTTDPFPRLYKNGNKSKGSPVQLKNSYRRVDLYDEFDFLLIIALLKNLHGLYLFSFDKVREILNTCSRNGYDGIGQVKLPLRNKKDCVFVKEINATQITEVKRKYDLKDIPAEMRNARYRSIQDKSITDQIDLTLKGV